ncbi:O-antigen ligase family protein [Cupriavidus sp. TMH.W2]|uniref:O-antigen ligase family protein n=1 Tax=Cupriavidus sp. TMH.W2 TaxID=3434465 RepID=UPI003D77C647
MRYFQWLIATALASFYVLALFADRAAGVIYGIIIALGLAALIFQWKSNSVLLGGLMRRYWPLALAMAAPMFAIIANELSRGQFSGRNIDGPSRLAMFALAFWAISLVPLTHLRKLQWAFIAGTFLSALKIYRLTHGGEIRYLTDFIPITIFIEMGLLLGVFALLSISWNSRQEKSLILLKLLAAVAILYGSYLSQSRGAWITIPIFFGIALVANKSMRAGRKLALLSVATLVLLVGVGHAKLVKERIYEAQTDIQQFIDRTNVDTSIGIRFQIWQGSVVIFKEHPVFGVGVDRYRDALGDLAERKIISPTTSTFAHSHNEFLFNAARLGLFGLAALLALYLVPAYYFVRDLRHTDREVRSVACMGLSLITGIFILGLTDVVFLWWEVFPFYAVSIATFIVYMDKRKGAAGSSGQGSGTLSPVR